MSCHSSPGNRAVISVARHCASAAVGREVPEADAARAFHALLGEGRRLDLPAPDRTVIARWFSEQEFRAAMDLPAGRSREAALRNLAEAREAWLADPSSVTGATFHAWEFTTDYTAYTAARDTHPDPLTVAFDCDGVLYDFNGTLREWLSARGWDPSRMPDPQMYNLAYAWGVTQDDLQREMPLAIEAGVLWHTGEPLRDGTTTAREVGLDGHRVLVNTARALPGIEGPAEAATVVWLRRHGVHPDAVHLSDPMDPADKLQAPFDVLFDDHPDNVAAAKAAGRPAFLIARSWNQDNTDHQRVTFADVPEIIDGLAAPMPTG